MTGKVILAGAGPGDPGLLTVKAAHYLQKADVVLTDRLASPEIIRQHVPARTQVIYVGKQGGSHHQISQQSINSLMIRHAARGKLVVRLKGGDVSLFSNILDELEALVQA